VAIEQTTDEYQAIERILAVLAGEPLSGQADDARFKMAHRDYSDKHSTTIYVAMLTMPAREYKSARRNFAAFSTFLDMVIFIGDNWGIVGPHL
jgi:hypothetical protein